MNDQQIKLLLKALGSKQISTKGKWVTGTCPLAPFTHKGGTDNNPSFGVKIGDHSPFNCFSCESGSLAKLVNTLDFHLQKVPSMAPFYDMKSAHQLVDGDELDFLPLPPYEEEFAERQVFVPWPEEVLGMFAKLENAPEAVEYLAHREGALTLEQANEAGLLYDFKKQMIVCPYRNAYGRLAGARGRSIDPDCPKAYRHFDYTYKVSQEVEINNAPLVWYNEQAFNLEGPVIVVEGQFDCNHVRKVWPKVVANLTAKPTREKLRKLSGCESVILMMDNDETGANARDKYMGYLKDMKVPVAIFEFDQQFHDPAQCPLNYLQQELYGEG
ncbi:primase [Stenotrophomonas phage vB_SmaS_DLP_3]|nr:primase [Stenotrophomonas phage vB_SmaS_DLP_3]